MSNEEEREDVQSSDSGSNSDEEKNKEKREMRKRREREERARREQVSHKQPRKTTSDKSLLYKTIQANTEEIEEEEKEENEENEENDENDDADSVESEKKTKEKFVPRKSTKKNIKKNTVNMIIRTPVLMPGNKKKTVISSFFREEDGVIMCGTSLKYRRGSEDSTIKFVEPDLYENYKITKNYLVELSEFIKKVEQKQVSRHPSWYNFESHLAKMVEDVLTFDDTQSYCNSFEINKKLRTNSDKSVTLVDLCADDSLEEKAGKCEKKGTKRKDRSEKAEQSSKKKVQRTEVPEKNVQRTEVPEKVLSVINDKLEKMENQMRMEVALEFFKATVFKKYFAGSIEMDELLTRINKATNII